MADIWDEARPTPTLPHLFCLYLCISISVLQGLGQGLPIQMNLNEHPLFLYGYIRLCIQLGD